MRRTPPARAAIGLNQERALMPLARWQRSPSFPQASPTTLHRERGLAGGAGVRAE
jgi:hypothetical protein